MKIDVHAHLTSRTFHEAIEALPGVVSRPNQYGRGLYRNGKYVVSFDDAWMERDHVIRQMDAQGVDIRLICLAPPHVYIFDPDKQDGVTRRVNDEMIAEARLHPDRLRVLASLPLGDVEAALKELGRIASAKEVVGLTIGSHISTVPISDPRFEPVWARINALKMPVLEHPLNPYFADGMQDFNLGLMIGYLFDTQLCVARMILNGVFERYPDFPFIVAHTGGGILGVMHRLDNSSARTPEAKANMKKSFATYAKNLYYDSCARYAPTIAHALDFAGADHVMYGTDYPYVYVDDSYLKNMDIPASTRAAIECGNAQRLFKL